MKNQHEEQLFSNQINILRTVLSYVTAFTFKSEWSNYEEIQLLYSLRYCFIYIHPQTKLILKRCATSVDSFFSSFSLCALVSKRCQPDCMEQLTDPLWLQALCRLEQLHSCQLADFMGLRFFFPYHYHNYTVSLDLQ